MLRSALGYALSDSFRLGPGTQYVSWASFLQSGHDSCGITCAVAGRRRAVAVLGQNVCRQPKEKFSLAYGWGPGDRGIFNSHTCELGLPVRHEALARYFLSLLADGHYPLSARGLHCDLGIHSRRTCHQPPHRTKSSCLDGPFRSEERRVGKECRSWW